MRWRAFVLAGITAAATACESPAETPFGAGALADAGGDAAEAAPPLVGAQVCPRVVGPVNETINTLLPAACLIDTVNPMYVLATATEASGRTVLAGGQAVAVPVDGDLPRIVGLANPFHLDGQAAHVPLVVAADGSFATDPGAKLFEWAIEILAAQPLLVLHDVSVTGTIDADGRPSSGYLAGRIRGCFTPENAAAIYIALLSQTVAQLMEASGTVLDCDATGSGGIDGYTLELSWSAGAAVDVFE
jgi:hypothetical protein